MIGHQICLGFCVSKCFCWMSPLHSRLDASFDLCIRSTVVMDIGAKVKTLDQDSVNMWGVWSHYTPFLGKSPDARTLVYKLLVLVASLIQYLRCQHCKLHWLHKIHCIISKAWLSDHKIANRSSTWPWSTQCLKGIGSRPEHFLIAKESGKKPDMPPYVYTILKWI